MAVVGDFYFSIFLLMWEFLDLEGERGGSVCWPNNKIIKLKWEFLDLESERGGSVCWPNNKITSKMAHANSAGS